MEVWGVAFERAVIFGPVPRRHQTREQRRSAWSTGGGRDERARERQAGIRRSLHVGGSHLG